MAIGQIRVNYVNDGLTSGGVDKNLRVDGLTLDGVVHQSEAANVFSTGTFVDGIGRMPGLWQSEYLHTNGTPVPAQGESAEGDGIPPELLERIRARLAAAPELRHDRVEDGRRLLADGVTYDEIASKMVGRIISDSLR